MRPLAALALAVVLLLVVGLPAALAADESSLTALPSWMQWTMGIGSGLVTLAFGGWQAWARLSRALPAAAPASPAPTPIPQGHLMHMEQVPREHRLMTQADLDVLREELKEFIDTRFELHEQLVDRAEQAAAMARGASERVQDSSDRVLAALRIVNPEIPHDAPTPASSPSPRHAGR